MIVAVPPDGNSHRRRGDDGVTLIELLVVLALIGALLGLGIGMYANLGKQGVFSATVGRVLSTMNRVRNSSMTHPAALQIHGGDPEKGELNAVQGLEFVTMWQSQCEPPAEGTNYIAGALDRNGEVPAAASFKSGVMGQAVFLEGSAIRCGNHPAYDATRGISIDMWVFPTVAASGTLVRRGNGLELSTTREEGGVGIRWVLAFATGGAVVEGAKPGSVTSENREFHPKDAVLPLNRWSRILCTYDGSHVAIAIDLGRGPVERLRERIPRGEPLAPSSEDELFIGGGGKGSFRGGIDDVRLESVLGESYEPFAAQIRVEGKSRRIYYLNGKLDPTRHTRPETIVLTYGKRRKEIVIGLEGNLEQK